MVYSKKNRSSSYIPENKDLVALNSISLHTHALFCLALFIDVSMLCFMISEISIYSKEARGFFSNSTLPDHIANFGVGVIQYFFHNPMLNDYGLRLPFVCLHIINCILLYAISIHILRKPKDALLCVLLFMSLPGVSVQALVVSNMEILTFLCFLIVYVQVRYRRIAYELFLIIIFLDSCGAILCLAMFFYAISARKNYTIIFSMVCFGINMYLFAPIHGVPNSYFTDTLGLMAIVFTPVFFVYYISISYNYTFSKEPLLLHFIPFIGFIFILLISTRQKIDVESFFPILCVGIPCFIQRVSFSISSLLPQFRFNYKMRVYILVLFLAFENIMLFGNKLTYLFVEKHNFAYSFYEAKEVAKALYERNITNINVPYTDLALRLRFYGINADSKSMPKYTLRASTKGQIKIIYCNVKVAQYAIVPLKH